MLKNGSGLITTNLIVKPSSSAINAIFCFTPLKKDSTTFFDALAPAYLNALYAKNKLGSIPIMPPNAADFADSNPQMKYIISVKTSVIAVIKAVC
jgi:hypothetical protein